MNAQLGKVIGLNGYPLSIVVAVILHTVLLASLLYLQGVSQTQDFELVQPTVIKALFLDENPQVLNQQKAERAKGDENRRLAQQAEYERDLANQKLRKLTSVGRVFRVLRPIRTLRLIPHVDMIVSTLEDSMAIFGTVRLHGGPFTWLASCV